MNIHKVGYNHYFSDDFGPANFTVSSLHNVRGLVVEISCSVAIAHSNEFVSGPETMYAQGN